MDSVYSLKVIKIFVSSTFRDMDFERDYLKDVIIPKLNSEFEKYNILIELCDLRSGICQMYNTEHEQDEYILNSCFSAIQSSRPYFIALLGDRYGWIPKEQSILNLNQIFHDYSVNPYDVVGKSVTEVEIELGCLNYKDSNKGIICFRSSESYKNMSVQNLADYVEEDETLRELLKNFKDSIRERCSSIGKDIILIDYKLQWDENSRKFKNLDRWGEEVFKSLKEQIFREESLDINLKEDNNARTQRLMKNFVNSKVYNSIDLFPNFISLVLNGIIYGKNKFVVTGVEGVGNSTLLSQFYTIISSLNGNVFPVFYSLDVNGADCTFNEILKYFTISTNNYVENIYGYTPVCNTDDPIDSLKYSVELVADKGYRMLFIIDSYDKILRYSNPFYNSLLWLPDNASVVIGVDLKWAAECCEDVEVLAHTPLIDISSAKKYIKSMKYNDLTDDILLKILEPLYKDRDEEWEHFKTPLYLKMVVDLLVDLNHNDYNSIRSNNKDYIVALNEYRKNIIPDSPASIEYLFMKLVNNNYSVLKSDGVMLLTILAMSNSGVTERTLRAYMELDEVEFIKVLSVTFNKLSRYITYSVTTNKWFFKYESCKRIVRQTSGKMLDYGSMYSNIAYIIYSDFKKRNLLEDDLFFYLFKSRNIDLTKTIISLDNDYLIRYGAKEIAEQFLNDEEDQKKECLDWCLCLLSSINGLTESILKFFISLFEELLLSRQIKYVIDQVKQMALLILKIKITYDFDTMILLIDFCNLMTDIFIMEDLHAEAVLSNNLAVGYLGVLSESINDPVLDSLRDVSLKQQSSLNRKNKGYRPQDDGTDKSLSISNIIEIKEEMMSAKNQLLHNPSLKNKSVLLKIYCELVEKLLDTDPNEAFMYHKEALSLIEELISYENDTNNLRTCSSYLFKLGENWLNKNYSYIAVEVFTLALEVDGQLLNNHETKENIVNVITVLNRLTQCCEEGDDESIKKYSRHTLYLISKLVDTDFDRCCNFWLKQAKICYEKKAYYESFYIYDTMADEIVKKNDNSYMFLLIETMINIAEIAFIDDSIEAGMHRISYAIQQINVTKKYKLNQDQINLVNSLEQRCCNIIKKYKG